MQEKISFSEAQNVFREILNIEVSFSESFYVLLTKEQLEDSAAFFRKVVESHLTPVPEIETPEKKPRKTQKKNPTTRNEISKQLTDILVAILDKYRPTTQSLQNEIYEFVKTKIFPNENRILAHILVNHILVNHRKKTFVAKQSVSYKDLMRANKIMVNIFAAKGLKLLNDVAVSPMIDNLVQKGIIVEKVKKRQNIMMLKR